MNELDWEPITEKINECNLTEEEKKIAKECSEIEMEFQELISEIEQNLEE